MIGAQGLVIYGLVYGLGVMALTVGWVWGHRTHRPGATHRGWAALGVLGIAAIARLAVAGADPPMLSDDLARYIDDGFTLAHGHNPYAASPHDKYFPDAVPPGGPINHPDLVTIYQPTSQWVFAGLWEAHAAGVSVIGRFPPRVTFRLGFIAADLAVIALLLGELRRAGRSPWWAALYAWHPLAITETAISAHQEPIGIALTLGACMLASRRREILAAVAMAAAIAVKPVIAPLALVLLWQGREVGWRRMGAAVAAGGGTLATLYGPFVLMNAGVGRMLHTAHVFVDRWAFNGSLHPWAMSLLGAGHLDGVNMAGMVALAIGVGLCLWRARSPWEAAGGYLLAALLLSRTVFPWYVLWALAVVPLLAGAVGAADDDHDPSGGGRTRLGGSDFCRVIAVGVWALAAVVGLSYTANINPPTGRPWAGAWAMEYGVVYAALGAAVAWWVWKRWRGRARSAVPRR